MSIAIVCKTVFRDLDGEMGWEGGPVLLMSREVTLHIAGLSLSEPVTFFTDILITIACYVFCRLLPKGGLNHTSWRSWHLFFGTLGVSTLLGGSGHLLREYGGANLLLCSWLLGGLAVFIFEIKASSLISRHGVRFALRSLLIFKFLVFGMYTLFYRSFIGVKIHAGLGLLFIVFVIHIIHFLRFKAMGSLFIMFGIILTTLSALIHSMRFTLSERWFNYNDLSHCVLLLSLYAIYRGAMKLES